jgi:uncharacterized iron-regulated membrane protein
MKLKGLSNRLYNITFHTHTVSGIVISFALYVIFFAGAFTLFKSEFYQWENPEARQQHPVAIDYDAVLNKLKEQKPQFNLSDDITVIMPTEERPIMNIYGHLIVPKGKPEEHYYTSYSPVSQSFSEEETTTIGETLYRLHFFDQIPVIGRYLSGFVALFFAFAVVTGVMIHWKNIFTKFNGFSLKGSYKQIWTNAHTVFGLLGLPFQFMYAITGAYYMLSFLVLAPVVMVFFDGDQEKAFKVILAERMLETQENSPITAKNLKLTTLLNQVKSNHPELKLNYLQIKHFDREDGIFTASVQNNKTFAGDGSVAITLRDGKVVSDNLPGKRSYAQSVLPGIARLHFATFGGLALKIIYFILALFACFVIISGVLLWKEARNKKNYTDKQKYFHHRVTMSYLAICFSMFPAIAILFAAELLVPRSDQHVFYVRSLFFISWLLLTIAGLIAKNEANATRLYLFSGSIFSLSVPIVNGTTTGDWIWSTIGNGNYFVAGTDMFWLVTGIFSLALVFVMRKEGPGKIISDRSERNKTEVGVNS